MGEPKYIKRGHFCKQEVVRTVAKDSSLVFYSILNCERTDFFTIGFVYIVFL